MKGVDQSKEKVQKSINTDRPFPNETMATCLRHSAPRIFKSFKSINSIPRYYSSSSDKSTYYIQRFMNTTEHYILLLPESSVPMGRMHIRNLPEKVSMVQNGPTVDYIDPIPSELIKQNWSTFVENGGFRTILQDVIKQNIAQDEMVINDAKTLQGGEGWVHLCDERALPAYGPLLSRC